MYKEGRAGFIYVDSGKSCLTAGVTARYSDDNMGAWPEWRQAFRQSGVRQQKHDVVKDRTGKFGTRWKRCNV